VLLHKKRGVGGVPLEVLQEKRGVGLQLHVFLGAEFVELDVFSTVELERSCPKHPLNHPRNAYNRVLLLFAKIQLNNDHSKQAAPE
jgi:hypothetical protein